MSALIFLLTLITNYICTVDGNPTCKLPTGAAGTCVHFHSCKNVYNKENAKQSGCRDPGKVCCEQTKTTLSPPADINEFCTSQQSAFPPDPSSQCCGIDGVTTNKIIGGTATTIDQYPWLALIEYERYTEGNPFLCGGALISALYVLTAAHCLSQNVLDTKGVPILVRLSEYDTSNEGEDCVKVEADGDDCTNGDVKINIKKYVLYPGYSTESRRDDIALIRLEKTAPFNYFIRPICLPRYDITLAPPEDLNFYTAGWGHTENKTHSKVKLHVKLPYVERGKCQEPFLKSEKKVRLWDNHLCAGGELGKDSCIGDSGGPLMYQAGQTFELHGVTNFGYSKCGTHGAPGVYAKVYGYIEWIDETIAKIESEYHKTTS